MKTSAFLQSLHLHASLPLVFRTGASIVSPGYHLTEVKRVSYETMDCGAVMHHWWESQFEVWVPARGAPDGEHMPAGKFLRIVDRVQTELPLNPDSSARVHASFDGGPAALYDVDSVTVRDGTVWVELLADRTRCKAAERRLAERGEACCGSDARKQDTTASGRGCGCETKGGVAAAVCCA